MIKRYTIIDSELYSGMITDDEEGEWVKWDDFNQLLDDNKQLQDDLDGANSALEEAQAIIDDLESSLKIAEDAGIERGDYL